MIPKTAINFDQIANDPDSSNLGTCKGLFILVGSHHAGQGHKERFVACSPLAFVPNSAGNMPWIVWLISLQRPPPRLLPPRPPTRRPRPPLWRPPPRLPPRARPPLEVLWRRPRLPRRPFCKAHTARARARSALPSVSTSTKKGCCAFLNSFRPKTLQLTRKPKYPRQSSARVSKLDNHNVVRHPLTTGWLFISISICRKLCSCLL